MPPVCVAFGCRNTNDQAHKNRKQRELEKKCKITFHVFPSDPIRKRTWINLMELKEKDIKKSSRLCSLHFHEKYFDRTSLVCVRLKNNAIPHLLRKPISSKYADGQGRYQAIKESYSNRVTCVSQEENIDLSLIQEEKDMPQEQCNKLQKNVEFEQQKADMHNKRQLGLVQPHLNTIYNWYKSIEGKSRISEEAIVQLQEELSSVDYFLVGASIIDEMSVR